MPKKSFLFLAILALIFALGCARFKEDLNEAWKEISQPKSQEAPKKSKPDTATGTPKETIPQKTQEPALKESTPKSKPVTATEETTDTTTQTSRESTTPKSKKQTPATSPSSPGASVFGPK